MKNYIEVTQDGIGRIYFDGSTPSEVQGLYTQGLATCLAIVLKGNRGVSLIHDTGRICNETIERELQEIGVFETIHLYFMGNKEVNFLAREQEYIRRTWRDNNKQEILNYPAIQNLGVASNDIPCLLTEFGHLLVNKQGNISTEYVPLADLEPIPDKRKRQSINILNNYMNRAEQRVPGDLQFDGQALTPLPELLNDIDFITFVATEEDSSNSTGILDEIAAYKRLSSQATVQPSYFVQSFSSTLNSDFLSRVIRQLDNNTNTEDQNDADDSSDDSSVNSRRSSFSA